METRGAQTNRGSGGAAHGTDAPPHAAGERSKSTPIPQKSLATSTKPPLPIPHLRGALILAAHMSHRPASAPPPRAAPQNLWRMVEAFLHTLFRVCGGPRELAARVTLPARQRAVLLQWIATAEALMRQMLLIEAAALGRVADTRPRTQARAIALRAPPPRSDDPAAWRVSFKTFAPARQSGQRQSVRGTRRSGAPLTRPLAARLEALRRVFLKPGPHARRLARRLRQTPARAADLIASNLHPRVDGQCAAALRDAALAARPAFDSG